ncbi:MAG: hypothetical protein KDI92_15530, partial [Xanthomonadales bacterium]|nr:hypothetical protein [Xanthomonadales bacterium]
YSKKGLAIRKADPNIPITELIEGLHNFANGLIIKKKLKEAFSVIEEITPLLDDDASSEEVRLRNWQLHYGLRSFYYGSMKDSPPQNTASKP